MLRIFILIFTRFIESIIVETIFYIVKDLLLNVEIWGAINIISDPALQTWTKYSATFVTLQYKHEITLNYKGCQTFIQKM